MNQQNRSLARKLQSSWVLVLALAACQPSSNNLPPTATPSPSSSASVTPSPTPVPTPSASTTAAPTPVPSTASPSPSSKPTSTPSPSVQPSATPTPSTTPEPVVSPLSFQRIKVIAGKDPENGELKSGTHADQLALPSIVSELLLDDQDNIWFMNVSNRILGFVSREIIAPSTEEGDIKYRIYRERVKDINSRGGMLLDPNSGEFYLVQTNQNRIVKVNSETGEITPIAGTGEQGFNGDGKALETMLNQPSDIARDQTGNLYITDTGNHLIRKLTPDGKFITIAGQYVLDTVVKDKDGDGDLSDEDVPSYLPLGETTGDGGPARDARLDTPVHITAEADGTLYFTSNSRTIRRIRNDLIDRYVGSGNSGYNGSDIRADLAHLNQTQELQIGPDGLLYFVDNLRIRRIYSKNGVPTIQNIAGNGKTKKLADSLIEPLSAEMEPGPFDFDKQGNLYLYDMAHRRIRMLEIKSEDEE